MKKIFAFIASVCLVGTVSAQSSLTLGVVNKVLSIQFEGKQGSSTLITINNKLYLATVRHLFVKADSLHLKPITIGMLHEGGWGSVVGVLHAHQDPNIDIALIELFIESKDNSPFDIKSDGYLLAQECLFLGFPHGLNTPDQGKIKAGFPFPFVKKGIISATGIWNGAETIFLDAHNNQGFSGGPVFTKINNKDAMIGVVCGFLSSDSPIITPWGNLIYKENTGILYAHSSKYIHEIIGRKK